MLEKQLVAKFEAYAADFMERQRLPGMVVCLAKGEEILYSRAFGYRDLEQHLEATTDTVFGIASITKSFTAMAVGKLVEQGKLGYDDPVVNYLPDFRVPGSASQDVTIRHLLTHTSGLPALDALNLSFVAHSSPDPSDLQHIKPLANPPINTYSQLINYVAEFPGQPLGAPGEYFNYSNEGFAILGALVRRVSGMPYAAFVRKHVIEPLNMSRTTYSFEEMYEHDEVTVLYSKQADGSLQASTRWPCAPACQAAGRIKSTVLDLIRPFQMYVNQGAFQGQRILSPEIVQQTLTPRYQFSLHEAYGHALQIHAGYHGVTLISHGGAGKGISAHAGIVPEQRLSAVVLTNLGGVPVTELWGALVNLGLGLPIETPRSEYTTCEWPEGAAEQLVGRYASVEGNEFTLSLVDGQLYLIDKQTSSAVKRVTAEVAVFGEPGHEQELKFYRDSVGRVRGIGRGVRFIPRAE